MKRVIYTIIFFFAVQCFAATTAVRDFANPADEKRFQVITHEVRCLVCEGQSVADSNSDFAQTMQDWVHEQIIEGMSDAQIREALLERFGDRIFYTPPVHLNTLLLWLLPAVFFALGLVAYGFRVMRR